MANLIEAVREGARRHRVTTWVIRLVFALFLIPLLAACFLYSQQHRMIYHPRPYLPREFQGLPSNLEELDFTTTAGSQSAFYVSPRGRNPLPDRLWVAFCGNGSLALDWNYFIRDYNNANDGFLLVDYPGYGKSQGYATIESTRSASDHALSALATRLGVKEAELEPRLNAIGHSLGAGVALDFAARHPVQRVIVFAPFTSLREEAAGIVGGPLSYLLVENYDNRARLKELADRSPMPMVAIVHGTDDDVIPFRMGQTLASEFPQIVEFFPITHGDHVSVLEFSRKKIFDWMNR